MNPLIEELDRLFISETIKPTFEIIHAILALYLFEQHQDGLGRYKLKEELLIGSGTARSLIERLRDKLKFLQIAGNHSRKGHALTPKGKEFLKAFRKKIPLVQQGDIEVLKNDIIEWKNISICISQVKDSSSKLTNGIEQRDAAIKIGGFGATCLYYDGDKINYALHTATEADKSRMRVSEDVQAYIEQLINKENSSLDKNDVLIIGLGNSEEELKHIKGQSMDQTKKQKVAVQNSSRRARLAALNAAITLI